MTSDDEKWAALGARDRRYDGRFVYAVRTTGVYCRPSCPARRARPENVAFYGTPGDAEGAGFRPCRRCRPHVVAGTTMERSVEAARAYLDARVGERVPLARLARAVGLSPWHVQRSFTRLVGVSPKAYQDARRRERFKHGLRRGETVSRAAALAALPAHARDGLGLGMSPGAYRRGGRGETIRYAVVPSAFGSLLVGATEHGVAAVSLGDSVAALEAALRAEFPAAALVRDDAAVGAAAATVVAAIERGESVGALPLDARGTAFQMRVWSALRDIPAGVTRTYSDIAAAIGHPTAVRAVANACAANRLALVIPCHRAVRADGALGGYRWGVERKRRLLDGERAAEPRASARRARA
jgi:AraC family transcriptional regulator, regulatory protein of adaptative response / methylated-DNA-[protein]-cysteine methyltransferase